MQYSTFYQVMPDGTVKQINPFTGNEVWAVPGRAARPIQNPASSNGEAAVLAAADPLSVCSFCEKRYFEVPPEKSRWIRHAGQWMELIGVPAKHYNDTVAEFRCVPNLFEIVSLDYW